MKPKINEGSPTDTELSKLLIEIAVENGLSVPTTEEEVTIFEEAFKVEIQKATDQLQSMKDVLLRAKNLNSSQTPILVKNAQTTINENHQMAARNGKGISIETTNKLDEAVSKERKNRNNGNT